MPRFHFLPWLHGRGLSWPRVGSWSARFPCFYPWSLTHTLFTAAKPSFAIASPLVQSQNQSPYDSLSKALNSLSPHPEVISFPATLLITPYALVTLVPWPLLTLTDHFLLWGSPLLLFPLPTTLFPRCPHCLSPDRWLKGHIINKSFSIAISKISLPLALLQHPALYPTLFFWVILTPSHLWFSCLPTLEWYIILSGFPWLLLFQHLGEHIAKLFCWIALDEWMS